MHHPGQVELLRAGMLLSIQSLITPLLLKLAVRGGCASWGYPLAPPITIHCSSFD